MHKTKTIDISQQNLMGNESYPIRRGFAPRFVYYKKGCTWLAAASDKVYQLLAHCQWFSPSNPTSSTTKTGCHDIAEILLKVALNAINHIKSLKFIGKVLSLYDFIELSPFVN